MRVLAVPLSDVLLDAKSGFACGEDLSDGVFQFRMNNITSEGTLELAKRRRIPRTTRHLEACIVHAGDVLFNATNSPELVGKSAFFPGLDEPAVFSNHFLRLRPNAQRLDGRFLAHWLNVQFKRRVFAGMCRQWVNQATVSRDSLLTLKLPVPTLEEQRRIAELLDRAAELRAKRRATLAKLDELSVAMFLHLLGDPNSNPHGWPLVPFAKLGENQDAQRVPVKSSDRSQRKGPYPYYGASGIIDWVNEYIFAGDRLLIGEDGANLIARATPVAYIARGKYWVNNHAHVIASNGRADLRFLECFIEHIDLKAFISGTAQPKLNHSSLDRIMVPVPPLKLQREFARRQATIERLKAVANVSLTKLDTLFASLQYRAFRGEL